LIGSAFLRAAPFGYAGNVSMPSPPDSLTGPLRELGRRLAAVGGLRGLFGVDGVLREGEFWPVEVNPRYPASVEVLELATGLRALHLHALAFEDERAALGVRTPASRGEEVGKAILYARSDVVFPSAGPWQATLDSPAPVEDVPAFADIPPPAERIPAGRPVLTLFARASSHDNCIASLQAKADQVEQRLYP
jgi:predicted ATP-grasp superfamily ATP-dependent carboligase